MHVHTGLWWITEWFLYTIGMCARPLWPGVNAPLAWHHVTCAVADAVVADFPVFVYMQGWARGQLAGG